ncbi:MAG: hypothetical protein HY362_04490 [Candidatus Aenigmarchaeota archaeon]|nr:hypothetical protein [Candidatus Aenigmarchaeota archaeon]
MDTEDSPSVLWMRQNPTDKAIYSAFETFRDTLGDVCHIEMEITNRRYEGRVVRLISYLNGGEHPRDTF